MNTESTYIPPPNVERHDDTTGETTNRGIVIDAPSRRVGRDAEWDDYCFRANCLIHGYDRAKAVWDSVRKADEEGWAKREVERKKGN